MRRRQAPFSPNANEQSGDSGDGRVGASRLGVRHGLLIQEDVSAPPRTWDESDLLAPRGAPPYLPTDSISPLPWGEYPSEDALVRRAVPGFALAPLVWRPVTEIGEPLYFYLSARRAMAGIPRPGQSMTVRRAVWPFDAQVLARDSASAVVASAWLPVGDAPDEVRCTLADAGAPASVRVVARLRLQGTRVEILPSVEATGAVYCAGTDQLEDRVRGYTADVFMALRSAARSVTPIPIRP